MAETQTPTLAERIKALHDWITGGIGDRLEEDPSGFMLGCDAAGAELALEEIVVGAYRSGFEAGVTAYAWMKDGTTYVGTTGRTLREALEKVEATYNYLPPRSED